MPDARAEPVTRTTLRISIAVVALLLAIVPAGVVAARDDRAAAEPDPDEVAAEQVLESMPLADRAAQVVMTSVPGVVLDHASVASLRALRPGGVILFGDNYRSRAQAARLTASVQAAVRDSVAAQPGVLVSIDQEGGVVKRIPDAPPTRSHPQLGATNRPALTRSQGVATGRVLRSLGVQLDLAPVADLDLRPGRVMRQRSFGSNPELVATHVAAFAAGLEAANVGASVKHFPGFGGANVNSDIGLARVTRTRAQLLDADLEPYRAAIAGGVDSVMVSHAVFTAIDRRRPGTLSPAVYALLREQLGYRGVAITDSLHAVGFTAATRRSPAAGCPVVIAAGADVALLTGTLAEASACRAAILDAVRSGTIPRARLDEAALRVLTLKSRRGLLP